MRRDEYDNAPRLTRRPTIDLVHLVLYALINLTADTEIATS